MITPTEAAAKLKVAIEQVQWYVDNVNGNFNLSPLLESVKVEYQILSDKREEFDISKLPEVLETRRFKATICVEEIYNTEFDLEVKITPDGFIGDGEFERASNYAEDNMTDLMRRATKVNTNDAYVWHVQDIFKDEN